MFRSNYLPFVPRDGHILKVGIVARISGCANQTELSLDDQVDHVKKHIRELYQADIDFRIIAISKGKGERIDRPELIQIDAEIRKNELDVLGFEDLGRLVRGARASDVVGLAKDHGVRTISINDYIDSADDNWEQTSLNACAEHVAHNAHTSRRIKSKLMNRFLKMGIILSRPIYGYIQPDGAKTYDELQKDPAAAIHVTEGLKILKMTKNYRAVAEYFNRNNVAPGPYCRRREWDGAMVCRFYHNPILCSPRSGRSRSPVTSDTN